MITIQGKQGKSRIVEDLVYISSCVIFSDDIGLSHALPKEYVYSFECGSNSLEDHIIQILENLDGINDGEYKYLIFYSNHANWNDYHKEVIQKIEDKYKYCFRDVIFCCK